MAEISKEVKEFLEQLGIDPAANLNGESGAKIAMNAKASAKSHADEIIKHINEASERSSQNAYDTMRVIGASHEATTKQIETARESISKAITSAKESISGEIASARDAVIKRSDDNTQKVINVINAKNKLSAWVWVVPILIAIATAVALIYTAEEVSTLASVLIAIATGGLSLGIFTMIDSATGGGKDEENEED